MEGKTRSVLRRPIIRKSSRPITEDGGTGSQPLKAGPLSVHANSDPSSLAEIHTALERSHAVADDIAAHPMTRRHADAANQRTSLTERSPVSANSPVLKGFGLEVSTSTLASLEIKPSTIARANRWAAAEYPGALAVLTAGGVSALVGVKHLAIDNPYEPGTQNTQDFRNVGEHCTVVGLVVKALGETLQGCGLMSAGEVKHTVERGLVHDANKRLERMRRDATSPEVAYLPAAYDKISELLQGQVEPELLAYLVDAGRETGHNSLVDFLRLHDGEPVLNPATSWAARLVHLADDMVHSPMQLGPSSFVVPVARRMELSEFPTRYKFLYSRGIGFDAKGQPVAEVDVANPPAHLRHVRTYAAWQVEVAKMIAAEIERAVTGKVGERSEEWLIKIVADRTRTQ